MTYLIEGPFPASEEPWLLSNQKARGILIQPEVYEMVYGVDRMVYAQPHGYGRGFGGYRQDSVNPDLVEPIDESSGMTPASELNLISLGWYEYPDR